MKRLLFVLLLVALLLALTPAIAYASPPAQDGGGDEMSDVGRVIGTLGLYAAMMMVLAVGAEVMIDAVRPIFGLKRQASATEALDKMNKWLPGTMAELGVSAEAQQQLNERIEKLEEVAAQFEDRAERVRVAVQEQLPDMFKDMAIHTLDDVLDKHWPRLEPRLKEIEPDLDTAEIRAWLEATLTSLKESNVAEISTNLHAISALLDTVRKQNNQLRGPLHKFWRWLRDGLKGVGQAAEKSDWMPSALIPVILFLCRLPAYPEYFWAWLSHKLPSGDTFRERIEKLGEHEPFGSLLTPEEAATRIFEEDSIQKDREKARISWLRILSVVVGIVLAAALQVDSIQLLEPVLGSAITKFCGVDATGAIVEWYTMGDLIGWNGASEMPKSLAPLGAILVVLLGLTPGVYLSGLGAAAGSAFWHDQLDKLRSIKGAASQVEELTGQLKGMTGG
ncbi:MAG: hypothetical protein B6I34_08470 [Anaerolineaceae bacterium 4572_32.1]|nr:MAG: hypothetical protein B6I34_08470 [Anaerolineaceae bacterium 4572_32.1]